MSALLFTYVFANAINVSVHSEAVVDEKYSETLYSQSALQVEYNFSSKVVGYVGYQVD